MDGWFTINHAWPSASTPNVDAGDVGSANVVSSVYTYNGNIVLINPASKLL